MTTKQYVYATTFGLYVTDGTSGNQTLIKAAVAGTPTAIGFLPDYAMAALPNGEVVFGATSNGSTDPLAIVEGGQLWVTDGTSGGTTLLTALPDPGAGNPGDDPGFTGFATAGPLVYGEYYDGSGSYFLVSTNGTQAGTTTVFNGLQPSSIGAGLGAAIGSSYVFADDTVAFQGFTPGLYITNGSATAPTLIKAVTAGTAFSLGFLPSTQMAALPNGEVVFGATSNGSTDPFASIEGGQLWVTNGTAGGTTEIGSLPDLAAGDPVDNSGFTAFVTAGPLVYGEYYDGVGDYFLEATNGTLAGTNTILNGLDPTSIGPGDGAAIGSNLVFVSNTAPYAGLYLANGTSFTATLIKATVAGTATTLGFLPGDQMAALPDGKVAFGATADAPSDNGLAVVEGIQLWVTDGTAGGTTELTTQADPNAGQPGDTAGFIDFVTAGNKVMFDYTDGLGDYFLYSTDGTAAGTTEIGQVDASSVGAGDGAPPCFAEGTRIDTPGGPVAVEALRAGDAVLTFAGVARPIRWLGHRHTDCRRHPKPLDVWPVRVRPGAFGAGLPHRDLLLSPDHAVFIDGVLIPVRYLVNRRTIAQEPRDEVTYWHVELDRHDVIRAEGLACETYLDTGNRGAFENAGPVLHLHPDFAMRVWQADACARLVWNGAELIAARSFLLERAKMLGHSFTRDPALQLRLDGHLLRPTIAGQIHRFRLSRGAKSARLISRSSSPAHVHDDSDDYRQLGVAVSGIALDGVAIPLTDLPGDAGWHDIEGGSPTTWRWTNGDAGLPLAGGRDLEIVVLMTARYWVQARAADAIAA